MERAAAVAAAATEIILIYREIIFNAVNKCIFNLRSSWMISTSLKNFRSIAERTFMNALLEIRIKKRKLHDEQYFE